MSEIALTPMIYVCRSQLMRISRPSPLKSIYYLSETFHYPERNTIVVLFKNHVCFNASPVYMTLHI